MLRVDVGTQVDTSASVQDLVESEYEDISSLRLQLAAAHQALRLQTARYRQATRRLEQQDLEINNMTSLRDKHLNRVLRALVVLEAGLRREQRSIRSQLGERDVLIRAQQHEISQLKKALFGEVRLEEVQPSQQQSEPKQFDYDCAVKPDLISSLGISHFQRCQVTPTTTDNEDCQSNLDSLQLSFYEISSQPESLLSNVSSQSCSRETPDPPREQLSSINSHNKYNLDESHSANDVNVKYSDGKNICKCQKDSLKHLKCDDSADLFQPGQKIELNPSNGEKVLNRSCPARSVHFEDRSSSNLKDCKPSPSTLLQEVRISGKNEYEDNPVLNCVNQILLRDQEEFLEEQRVLRLKEEEKSKKETEAKINNQKLSRSTDNLELLNEKMIVQHFPVKNIITPPLESVISRQQKIHQTTRKKHTSLNKFKEDHLKTNPQLQHPLDLSLLKENVHKKSTPPALPPKPQRLITNHKSFDQKTMKSILPQLECGDSLNIIRKRVSLHSPSDELYVISNSAIDDEVLLQLQGKEIDSYSEPNKPKPLIETKGNIYSPVLIHPTHKSPVKPPHFPSKTTQTPKDDNLCKNVQQNSLKKAMISPTSYIKVASPVACLINSVEELETTADGNSEKQPSPSVSQIVRKFEDLGSKSMTISEASETYDNNNLQKNFEEFHLDECDMDDVNGVGRPEGDGAETGLHVSAMALEAKISYENFLDATGLSQKSIATPSRLFSNHKRVMKPKDVKHRSRVKAVDRCSNIPASAGSVVRYWTEPFL